MVKCNTCGKSYKQIFDTQGDGCAADIYLKDGEYYLIGYYGSKVADMRRYRLKNSTAYETGTICDDCINNLINDGTAILIEDGIW